jgi:hypothetical protein
MEDGMANITGSLLGDQVQLGITSPTDNLLNGSTTVDLNTNFGVIPNPVNGTIDLNAGPVIELGLGGSVPNSSSSDPLLRLGVDSQPLLGDATGQIVNGLLGSSGLDGNGNVLTGLGGTIGGATVGGGSNTGTGGVIAGVNDVVGTLGGTAQTVGALLAQAGADVGQGNGTPPGAGPGSGPNAPNNPPPGTASAGVQIFHTTNGDVMIGTLGDDTMTGNVGNDHFYGLGGNDTIDGGFGYDTAFYQGARADYTGAFNNGTLTLTDSVAGRDGVDSVKNVERISFTDSTIAFDINGDAGQAYRLYQAAFDRTPDQPGVSFWTARLDHGQPLQQVAQEFLNSAEFQEKYGASLSDHAFTNALYENVLDRSADASGLAYWDNAMAQGATRAQMLASFSESAENHAKVDSHLANGILLDYGVYV